MRNLQEEITDTTTEEIILPGKLQDKIRKIVSEDNEKQKGAFDPEDQCERLGSEHFYDIVKHPEFSVIAVQKMIRQVSGQIARSGVAALLESFDFENGKFCLLMEKSLTFKIQNKSGVDQYVPIAVATPTHFEECAQRIMKSAEAKYLQAERVSNLFAHIRMRMRDAQVDFFGKLALNGEIKFSI